MNNCIKCGGTVRLGAFRVSVGRSHGVHHYIEHYGETHCKSAESFTCTMMKPYPKNNPMRPSFALQERWQLENPAPSDDEGFSKSEASR